ncbi:MAG TPA: flagellar motor protein MotB [Bryobacteraceae bacterium]|nr:flagellar motor protein MotB [Bryobacteraceae bacterium]HPT27800.1 flagellar motor protein MotB [Bryobacteraceae bacterium]
MGSSPSSQPPIIVIRKKGGHAGHHGGAWKVAYADFVTAMMALFIVLWLLASSEEVQKAVGGYFQDPTGSGRMQGSTNAGVGDALSVTRDDMAKLQEKLASAMREMPEMKALEKNVQMTITSEGLRIELLEKEGGLWFESGSSALSANGREMVSMLGKQLHEIPNKLVIEGHTDAKPYASVNGYTNWELSTERANMARRLLVDAGVLPGNIAQVRGFADVQLRNKLDPFDPTNRRITVIVQYRDVPRKPGGDSKKSGGVREGGGGGPSGAGEKQPAPASPD